MRVACLIVILKVFPFFSCHKKGLNSIRLIAVAHWQVQLKKKKKKSAKKRSVWTKYWLLK